MGKPASRDPYAKGAGPGQALRRIAARPAAHPTKASLRRFRHGAAVRASARWGHAMLRGFSRVRPCPESCLPPVLPACCVRAPRCPTGAGCRVIRGRRLRRPSSNTTSAGACRATAPWRRCRSSTTGARPGCSLRRSRRFRPYSAAGGRAICLSTIGEWAPMWCSTVSGPGWCCAAAPCAAWSSAPMAALPRQRRRGPLRAARPQHWRWRVQVLGFPRHRRRRVQALGFPRHRCRRVQALGLPQHRRLPVPAAGLRQHWRRPLPALSLP